MSDSKIRIALCGNSPLLWIGLEFNFLSQINTSVVLKCEDILRLISESLSGVEVHVVILNIATDTSGLHEIAKFKKIFPKVKIIALIENNSGSFLKMQTALAYGVESCIYTNSTFEEYYNAVITVYAGGHFISDFSGGKLQPSYLSAHNFKPKEMQVIKLICDGMETKEAAKACYTTERSFGDIRQSIKKKMGVKTIAGLVTYAVKAGLVI